MKDDEMNEIKLCSYCESVPQGNTWTLHGITETRYFCPNPDCPHSVRTVRLEQWNTRPIEDELQKRIAELEADNAEFRQLIRDWSIVLDQNNGFQLWHVESVRQAMLEIVKGA